jgi:hypothetical protein
MVRKRRHEVAEEVQDDDSSAERSEHHDTIAPQRPGGRLQVPSTSDATAEAAHEDGETEQVRLEYFLIHSHVHIHCSV